MIWRDIEASPRRADLTVRVKPYLNLAICVGITAAEVETTRPVTTSYFGPVVTVHSSTMVVQRLHQR